MRQAPGACVLIFLALSAQAASPLWSQRTVSGSVPHARYGHIAVYDPGSNRMIVFGGRYGGPNDPQANTGVLNDLWILTNANGTGGPSQWLNVTPSSSPSPTWGHSAIYDPIANTMLIAGGTTGFNNPCTCDVWLLTNANGVSGSPAWSRLSISCQSGSVGPRTMMPSAFNPASTGMLLIGGSDCGNGGLPQAWVIGNASSTVGAQSWIHLTPGGTKLEDNLRITGTSIYDADNDRMVIWGASFAYPLNQLIILDNGAGRGTRPLAWTILTTASGPASAANSGQVSIYNAVSNRAVFFGGVVPGSGFPQLTGATNETWRLDNANGLSGTPGWTRVTFGGAVPGARTMNSAVYDSSSDRMIIFGGGADGGSTSYNDVWILDGATGSAAPNNPLQLSPASLTFGNTTVGAASISQNVNLTSSGPGAIPVTIGVSGDFEQTDNCPSSLQPSQPCSISVSFRPTAAGSRTGTLTATPSGSAPVQASLTGTGVTATTLSGAFTINGSANSNTPFGATVGQALTFAGSEPSNASFNWSFGDGSASVSGRTVQHTYASAGTFTVTLTVTSGAAQVTGTGQVTATALVTNSSPRRRSVQPPKVVIDTATKVVSAASGGTVTTPGGISVQIAPNAMPNDRRVTVTALASFNATIPGGFLEPVGPAVQLTFEPLSSKGDVRPASAAPGTIAVSIPTSLSQVIPLAKESLLDLLFAVDGHPSATGIEAVLSSAQLQALLFASASVRAGVTIGFGRNPSPELSPDPSTMGLRYWSPGHCWTALDPGVLIPNARTCVFVHGVNSSVEGAYPTKEGCTGADKDHHDCIDGIASKNGCRLVVGFNYNWTQNPEESAQQLAAALDVLGQHGIRNTVIEAHSLGGVVAMGAISRISPANPISFERLVTLGSPLMGTPAAETADNFLTSLMYSSPGAAALLYSLSPRTLTDTDSVRGKLQPSSDLLRQFREQLRAKFPDLRIIAVAGKLSPLPKPLSTIIFASEDNDGVIPAMSALGIGFNGGGVDRLDPVALKHTDLECGTIEAVASALPQQPPQPVMSVSTNPASLQYRATEGGASPDGGTLTVTNSGTSATVLEYAATITFANSSDHWIGLSGLPTRLPGGASDTYNIVLNITGVAASTTPRSATILVKETTTNQSKSIPVTLTIDAKTPTTQPPTLAIRFVTQDPRSDVIFGDYSDPDGDAKTIEYQSTAYAVYHGTSGNRTSATSQTSGTAQLKSGTSGSQFLTYWSLGDPQIIDARNAGDLSITQFEHVHAQAVDAAGNRSAAIDRDHQITLDMKSVLVTLAPASVTLKPGQTQQFTPTVSGTTNQSVTWTLTGVGTVSPSGLYTAPATEGTATVSAQSVVDPNASSDAAAITVSQSASTGLTGTWKGNYTLQQNVSAFCPNNPTITHSGNLTTNFTQTGNTLGGSGTVDGVRDNCSGTGNLSFTGNIKNGLVSGSTISGYIDLGNPDLILNRIDFNGTVTGTHITGTLNGGDGHFDLDKL